MTPAEKTLGKWARASEKRLTTLGWEGLVVEARGRSQLSDTVGAVPHKAARLLDHLRRKGAGVVMHTPPWTKKMVQLAAMRGSHKSASDYTEFVCQELIEFCTQGYWMVLPLVTVQDWPKLRLSPLGVVPQRERRPRLIVDYTFSNVNKETLRLPPPEAMQFGRALQRVLSNIVHADPKYGPPKMAKIDIADGFYRVWIRASDVPTLGVVLPRSDDAQTTLVAFPLALPMGWVESPPYFTTLTETACDLTNRAMSAYEQLPEHRLEAASSTPPAGHSTVSIPKTWALHNSHFLSSRGTRPLAAADVYVDDFLLLAQTKRMQAQLMRQALTSIDQVFRPVDASDPVHRKEPTSLKKLLQGDAAWSTQKRMLGWDLDTVAGTLTLPPHRIVERLLAILERVQPPRKRLPTTEWHQILGELRSMTAGLPGSRGLFSVLQDTLSKGDKHRIRLNRHVFDIISDFRFLLDSLSHRPTRMRELVPVTPSDTGACDACRIGMGGVWFDALALSSPPIVWRSQFPETVQSSLITSECPKGTISISDLELAGTIAHKDILANARHIHERTLWVAGDNRASISWATKGSSTSTTARAYLLRLNALHQRTHRYVARHHYIPGTLNSMADDAKHLLATTPTSACHDLGTDWCAIQATMHSRFSAQRDSAFHTTWRLWTAFCAELGLDAVLTSVPGDKIPVLQLFAHRYRHGILSARGRPVRSRTVEDAVRSVGQKFARMGSPDPRLNVFGVVDLRLSTLYQAWKKTDTPPARVKPLPMGLVRGAVQLAHAAATPIAFAAADCLTIAFYFLLRPGEYAGSPKTAADDLFRLQDAGLWIGGRQLSLADCPLPDLQAATFGTLTFTSQKNGIRGETIGHARSGHPTLCPVICLASRVRYLRIHNAGPTVPLNATRSPPGTSWHYLQPAAITGFLRAAALLSPDTGITPSDISARSTRAGGAMAMMCAGIDGDRIRLIGRWRSDEMYQYLHVQAQPVMNGVAAAMLHGGHYRLTPGALPTLPAPPP